MNEACAILDRYLQMRDHLRERGLFITRRPDPPKRLH
jgi:hypothetical protein